MAAGVVCRIGDDSLICHISRKEERFDFDEVMSIEGTICVAQARPGSSAGGWLQGTRPLDRRIPSAEGYR